MFDFDSGVIASVLVGVLEGSTDVLSGRRTLYNRSRKGGELDIAPLFHRFTGG